MKKQLVILSLWLMPLSGLHAIPKTCILHYPTDCNPIFANMQISFNCKSEQSRKLSTQFSLMNLFTSAYMPETLKFASHALNYFIWECPE